MVFEISIGETVWPCNPICSLPDGIKLGFPGNRGAKASSNQSTSKATSASTSAGGGGLDSEFRNRSPVFSDYRDFHRLIILLLP